MLAFQALAQGEFNTWYFGRQAGLAFTGPVAVALTDGALLSGEGCATISDAQGNLLFYTNGVYAWNRLHRLMANGRDLGGFGDSLRSEVPPNSATQGVTVVPRPGSSTEYYVFTVDAAENGLKRGLQYAVVDLARQNGLGEVVRKAVPVPNPLGDGRLTEKLVAVRHANQRDIWLVVHGWNSNQFLSYLLTSTGLSPSPVVSAGGSVHRGGPNPRQDYNALGYMKVSPTGRRLVSAQYGDGILELFDFNYGTGVVSGPRRLPDAPSSLPQHYYGVEFSPDGNMLYAGSDPVLYQYNLQTSAITEVARIMFTSPWALQLGPDQKIYGAFYGPFSPSGLFVIGNPNAADYQYRFDAVPGFTPSHKPLEGLPNVLVRPPVPGELLANFGLQRSEVCLGEAVSFAASLYPAIPDATVTWDFGEPTAGTGNKATGRNVLHRYAGAGVYAATMTVREVSGPVHVYSQSVTVLAPTDAHLAVDRPLLCSGTPALLGVKPSQPGGTTYRWQDGSTAPQFTAHTSGRYWVEVTAPQRCPVRDSLTLTFLSAPTVSLGPDQTICATQRLTLSPGEQPFGTAYRWQDGSTGPRLEITGPGTYAVTVTSAAGCTSQATVVVRFGDDCLFTIPNVITPNGDGRNETFVLQGLEPNTWNIQIYNRWGKQVYQQVKYQGGWDAGGQPEGLYYYLLVQPLTGRQYKGWVEVIR
ncbi:hypothetical protein BEN49_23130 [Hymenobacter coccineus]|uniref:PKD domain-containing protein n=1 Tax=Hymenobacter coccineus TaxID=1908235 RepID=A0A1G1THJ3_9BACT|nr:hypothetical protein BEN49_23130 [Hymenobacter coccineus]